MQKINSYAEIAALKKKFWKSMIVMSVIALVVISVAATIAINAMRVSIFKTDSVKIIQNNMEDRLRFNLNELADKPQAHKDVLDIINYMAKAFDMVEVKIWTENMRVVYSYADRNNIGKVFTDAELKKAIDHDKITLSLDDGQDFENKTLGKMHKPLLEMYVPIHLNGRVHGIVEVYRLAPGLNILGKVNLYVALVVLLLSIAFNLLITTKIRVAMNTLIEFQDDLDKANKRIAGSYHHSVESLAKALEMRDKETVGHCERVVNMSMYIGNKMGLDTITLGKLALGAYLHDVGKIGVPDSILLKPGRLTPEEREVMETHVIKGFDIIKDVPFLRYAESVVKYHHEKFNGKGYPFGLKGDEIPVEARIFALVDVFDALISKRPYKEPMPIDQILEIIRSDRGEHFCPEVCDIVLNMSREELLSINSCLRYDGISAVVDDAISSLIAEEARLKNSTMQTATA